MKTSSKLFGGSHILHLTSIEEKKDVLEHIYSYTKITLPERKKPYKLLSNNNIPILQNGYYAMAVPDDLDIFIYFTRYRGVNRCFLICRDVGAGFTQPKILLIFPNCNNNDIYNGTLIEATRVYATDNRFFILMRDIQWYKGENIKQENIIDRLKHLGELLKDYLIEDFKQFPFRLQIATPYEHLKLLEQRLNNLPYKVDRILFIPPYRKTDILYYPLTN